MKLFILNLYDKWLSILIIIFSEIEFLIKKFLNQFKNQSDKTLTKSCYSMRSALFEELSAWFNHYFVIALW